MSLFLKNLDNEKSLKKVHECMFDKKNNFEHEINYEKFQNCWNKYHKNKNNFKKQIKNHQVEHAKCYFQCLYLNSINSNYIQNEKETNN